MFKICKFPSFIIYGQFYTETKSLKKLFNYCSSFWDPLKKGRDFSWETGIAAILDKAKMRRYLRQGVFIASSVFWNFLQVILCNADLISSKAKTFSIYWMFFRIHPLHFLLQLLLLNYSVLQGHIHDDDIYNIKRKQKNWFQNNQQTM